jgi:hypothetical protein
MCVPTDHRAVEITWLSLNSAPQLRSNPDSEGLQSKHLREDVGHSPHNRKNLLVLINAILEVADQPRFNVAQEQILRALMESGVIGRCTGY